MIYLVCFIMFFIAFFIVNFAMYKIKSKQDNGNKSKKNDSMFKRRSNKRCKKSKKDKTKYNDNGVKKVLKNTLITSVIYILMLYILINIVGIRS
ncbi:hypothetical protein CLPU_16c00450 [Gottschalkia purinilytica]|uniref:Uncharacterized protein n=1 Tax=Gottschalkia purinilytica TaxID=1503 RepID=A0A0L0W7K5_GOTPU|nr:hypothetical protein [Gottschalkia purinilytica]KNF07489.1 hypothetical protein CLPU_16c00450 [Gottschalkia purinilytica]